MRMAYARVFRAILQSSSSGAASLAESKNRREKPNPRRACKFGYSRFVDKRSVASSGAAVRSDVLGRRRWRKLFMQEQYDRRHSRVATILNNFYNWHRVEQGGTGYPVPLHRPKKPSIPRLGGGRRGWNRWHRQIDYLSRTREDTPSSLSADNPLFTLFRLFQGGVGLKNTKLSGSIGGVVEQGTLFHPTGTLFQPYPIIRGERDE